MYINLMDKFRSALLRTLGEDNIPTYGPKDPLVEEKDMELIRIGFGGDQRDSCFTSLANPLGSQFGCSREGLSKPKDKE